MTSVEKVEDEFSEVWVRRIDKAVNEVCDTPQFSEFCELTFQKMLEVGNRSHREDGILDISERFLECCMEKLRESNREYRKSLRAKKSG